MPLYVKPATGTRIGQMSPISCCHSNGYELFLWYASVSNILQVLKSKVVMEKAIENNTILFLAQLHTQSNFQIKTDL